MPPGRDDLGISSDGNVIRGLISRWTVVKNGRERPTSDSLLDSSYENSCFIEGEVSIEQVQQLFPGQKLAVIPIAVIRREGFAIERRPEEAPDNCPVPEAHVVIGPLAVGRWGDYERAARNIVKNPAVQIIYPPEL